MLQQPGRSRMSRVTRLVPVVHAGSVARVSAVARTVVVEAATARDADTTVAAASGTATSEAAAGHIADNSVAAAAESTVAGDGGLFLNYLGHHDFLYSFDLRRRVPPVRRHTI